MKCKMIRVSALHLGFACSVINLAYVISRGSMTTYYYSVNINIWMDLLLFCVLLFWCKHSLDASYFREKYIDAVERYKNSVEKSKLEKVD